MPFTRQPAHHVGLLEITATIGLIAGAVWLAGRRTEAAIRRLGRRAEESAILTEVRAIGPRIDNLVRAVGDGNYAVGYSDAMDNRPPTAPQPPPRQFRVVN